MRSCHPETSLLVTVNDSKVSFTAHFDSPSGSLFLRLWRALPYQLSGGCRSQRCREASGTSFLDTVFFHPSPHTPETLQSQHRVQLRCIIGCFRESPGECCRELGQCFGTSAIVPQYASPFHHSLVSHFTYTQHPRATPKCHSQLESHRNQQWIMCSHSTAGSKHIPVTLFQIVPVGKTQPVTLSALETSEKIYESFDRCSQHLLRNQILSP